MIGTVIRTFPVTIAAGRTEDVSVSGAFFKVLSSTSETPLVYSFDNGLSTEIPAGVGIPMERFDAERQELVSVVFNSVQIKNETTSDVTVFISVSTGEPSDSRSFIQGWVQVDMSAPYMTTPEAAAVATDAFTILPSNALIKERLVQNTGEFPIWWGDETTDPDTKRGLRIDPYGTATINVRGVVYLKAEGGASTLSINNIMKG